MSSGVAAASGSSSATGAVGQALPIAPVAIFWDYENIRVPADCVVSSALSSIREVALQHGRVSVLKAYMDTDLERRSSNVRSQLQSGGVSIIDTPHNGKKEVADHMMIVDLMCFALDNPAPATIILISGDKDFAYALSTLRNRRYKIIIIHQRGNSSPSLTAQAEMILDWRNVLGLPSKTIFKRDSTAAGFSSNPRSLSKFATNSSHTSTSTGFYNANSRGSGQAHRSLSLQVTETIELSSDSESEGVEELLTRRPASTSERARSRTSDAVGGQAGSWARAKSQGLNAGSTTLDSEQNKGKGRARDLSTGTSYGEEFVLDSDGWQKLPPSESRSPLPATPNQDPPPEIVSEQPSATEGSGKDERKWQTSPATVPTVAVKTELTFPVNQPVEEDSEGQWEKWPDDTWG